MKIQVCDICKKPLRSWEEIFLCIEVKNVFLCSRECAKEYAKKEKEKEGIEKLIDTIRSVYGVEIVSPRMWADIKFFHTKMNFSYNQIAATIYYTHMVKGAKKWRDSLRSIAPFFDEARRYYTTVENQQINVESIKEKEQKMEEILQTKVIKAPTRRKPKNNFLYIDPNDV